MKTTTAIALAVVALVVAMAACTGGSIAYLERQKQLASEYHEAVDHHLLFGGSASRDKLREAAKAAGMPGPEAVEQSHQKAR